MIKVKSKSKFLSVNKFYFLDYFYVLLKSIENYNDHEKIFSSFRTLKEKYLLGESKYKKRTKKIQDLSEKQVMRYKYTFNQVLEETLGYELITVDRGNYTLTTRGEVLLSIYKKNGSKAFNQGMFKLMEKKYKALYYIINFCYDVNAAKSGLLIFPVYSPLKLSFERTDIIRVGDLYYYLDKLKNKLEEDILNYLCVPINLDEPNKKLKKRLINSGLTKPNIKGLFNPDDYNIILKRIRDYWLNFFLKEIYKFPYSFQSFEIWAYRAKQVGIIHVTEFYPNFNGRIVYPTSIIVEDILSQDFDKLYEYENGKKLFIHNPKWSEPKTQNEFIHSLTNHYFDLRKYVRSYYVNLADLRELVCYNLKISEDLFDEYLEKAYRLNLIGKLKINISLEADRLPQETNAMYLKREPVKIEGKEKNIIAIDIAGRGAKNGKKRKELTS